MISNRHVRFLRQAQEIASKVDNGTSWHFGALLCIKNRVISTGENYPFRTHRRSNTNYHNIHAELDAVLGVPKDKLVGTTLYIVRLGYDFRKHLMLSRPCSHCEFVLRQAQIREVFYSIDDNTIGYWNLSRNEEYSISQEAA